MPENTDEFHKTAWYNALMHKGISVKAELSLLFVPSAQDGGMEISMAKYFRGESNYNVHYEVDIKDLSPLKKVMCILCFILWIPFAGFLFIPGMLKLGVVGLIAIGTLYIPFVCIYVPDLRGRQRTVPYILMSIGILGEIGYLLASAYIERHGFTLDVMVLICCVPIFLGFSIPGICMSVAGIKRNRKWKIYNRSVMATVVEYKKLSKRTFSFDNEVPGLNNPANQTIVYSPVIQYYADGRIYTGEVDSYFGKSQVPAVGEQIEIHVNPTNPNDFILQMQSGGMLIGMGISFIVVSIVAVIMGTVVIALTRMMF